MKHRPQDIAERDAEADLDALARVLAGLSKPEDVRAFLEDLCTPAELEAMADRWKVVPPGSSTSRSPTGRRARSTAAPRWAA